MAEQAKSEAKKPFPKGVFSRSLKTIKNTIRLLCLIVFLLAAPYIISFSINFFKSVICGSLNMSDFVVDPEANGISTVNNFYLGVVELISGLAYRLTH